MDISLKQQIVEVIKLVGGWFAWGSALSSPGWRSPVSGRVNHISGPVAPIYTTATTPPYICNSRAQVPNRPKTTKKQFPFPDMASATTPAPTSATGGLTSFCCETQEIKTSQECET